MSRLKSSTYLEHRRFLNYAWDHFKIIYGVLSMKQQADLHRYCQTDVELPDDELLATRTALTSADPSLPNRAGKAFIRLDGAFRIAYEQSNGELLLFHQAVWRLVPQRYKSTATSLKGSAAGLCIQAVPVVTRRVDLKLLAKALLMQAADEQAQCHIENDRAA